MRHSADEMRRERDNALEVLRTRLEKARQGASRMMAGQPPGPDADAMRQVYASHIAWLEDRILEMENLNPDDT